MFKAFPNIIILSLRLLLALVTAAVCRLLFLIFNPLFFSFPLTTILQAFLYGILFDVSAIIYLYSLFILLHFLPFKVQHKKWFQYLLLVLFILSNGLSIILNMIDIGYFPFSGRRSGLELLNMRNEIGGMGIVYASDYWYLFVCGLLVFFASVMLYVRTIFKFMRLSEPTVTPGVVAYVVMYVCIAVFLFIGARGSIGLLPLNTFDAARQTNAELVPLVVNTPFNMIISTQQSGLQSVHYLPSEFAKKWFDPIQHIDDTSPQVSTPPNIVLIIVESLGKEYIGSYNNGKGYTPFIDSLMSFSTVYKHAYANGKKSVEGIPAILASMPSWMNTPYLSSYYQGNHITSAGAYLKELGYHSSFYHGGKNGTMSFDNFIAISQSGEYYGMNQYPDKNDFDGNWGIYDEPYLQYFVKELSTKSSPFFSTVFTLSSHHPYTLPDAYKGKFPSGTLPIHATIGYADFALKQFFATAAKKPWYSNTIFIITADHSAENETPYYQSPQGKYEIPLIVFKPANKSYKQIEQTVSQLDIMPMVLKEAHYNKAFFTFGDYYNHAEHKRNGAAVQYQDQYYQLVQWPYIYQFDGQKELGFYNLGSDSLMRDNLVLKRGVNPKQIEMDSLLKSIIQQYHNNLINNTTTVGD